MNELKQKIIDGTYQAGDKMSSENELAAFYQVSRHTVRKALAILEHEGYIYAVHGKGTFCSEMGRHTKTSRKYRCCDDIFVRLYFSVCYSGN